MKRKATPCWILKPTTNIRYRRSVSKIRSALLVTRPGALAVGGLALVMLKTATPLPGRMPVGMMAGLGCVVETGRD
jgi:hypothetical protein